METANKEEHVTVH